MIFIGYNHEGFPISIISAADRKSANAYWQGKEELPHSVAEFEVDKLRENEKLGYVTPLLSTHEREIYIEGRHRKCIIVNKS